MGSLPSTKWKLLCENGDKQEDLMIHKEIGQFRKQRGISKRWAVGCWQSLLDGRYQFGGVEDNG